MKTWRPELTEVTKGAISGVLASRFIRTDDFYRTLIRTILDSTGANAEIYRLTAVLHAAHTVQETLRQENDTLYKALAARNDDEVEAA